jgi:hypothetical protein
MRIPRAILGHAIGIVGLPLLAASCSSSSNGATSSNTDAGENGLDSSISSDGSTGDDSGPHCASRPAAGTLPADVAAIIATKCDTCHSSPPKNHAPFPIENYTDVNATDPYAPYTGQPIWEVIGTVIQPNATPHMPFGNAPQLSAQQLQTLTQWSQNCGLPAGSTGADGGAGGNILVADQYNNRVIEVTRAGDIVFSFGDGSSTPGPTSVVAPNDAERLPNGRTLISGTGGPEPTCPNMDGGACCPNDGGVCADNRVIIVDDATGSIVWQYGPTELSSPVAAVLVPTSGGPHILITDQGNNRVIEVDEAAVDAGASNPIVWQFPPLADASAAQMLSTPNSAERLANGNTLIADEGGNRVIEVQNDGAIVWQYPTTIDPTVLSQPAFASRLPNGNTLIADSMNNRILEVTQGLVATVLYSTAMRNPMNPTPLPTRAVRLANGDTLIADQGNDQVIEIDSTPAHDIVFSYGQLGIFGNAPGQLSSPYDAKVVGDFTGLTPPM